MFVTNWFKIALTLFTLIIAYFCSIMCSSGWTYVDSFFHERLQYIWFLCEQFSNTFTSPSFYSHVHMSTYPHVHALVFFLTGSFIYGLFPFLQNIIFHVFLSSKNSSDLFSPLFSPGAAQLEACDFYSQSSILSTSPSIRTMVRVAT